MPLITIVGSLNYDITTYIKIIPSANETSVADDVQYNLGGKGFNQCIGLTKCKSDENVEIRMVGSIGDKDHYGDLFLQKLQQNNIIIDNITKIQGSATGLANIIVESGRGHANRIMIFAGANKYTKFDKKQLRLLFDNGKQEFIVLQNEIPEPLDIITYLIEQGEQKCIVYNPSPFNAITYPDHSIWKNIGIIVVNEIEMFQLAQALNVVSETDVAPGDNDETFVMFFENLLPPVANAIKYPEIASQDLSGVIVVTLGSKGYLYYNYYTKTLHYEPASKLIAEPIDSTGCGDTFLGFFTTSLAESLDNRNADLDFKVLNALKLANIAAGIAVTRPGASSSIPSRQEVKDLFKI